MFFCSNHRLVLVLVGLCLVPWAESLILRGGEFNPVLNIGDLAPAWDDLEGVDGERHSSEKLRGKAATVVVFTSNSCPYARDVEDRIISFTKRILDDGDQVRLVAINVNLVGEDLLPAMKQRASEKGFPFPYLHDPSQEIARKFGATRTPEFFLLDQDWKVVYMGALDDSPDGSKVTDTYLESALASLRAGTEIVRAETVPIGCRIRFQTSRR